MKIVYYPDKLDLENDSGPVVKFLRNLQRKDPKLWIMVKKTMDKAEKYSNLDIFEKQS